MKYYYQFNKKRFWDLYDYVISNKVSGKHSYNGDYSEFIFQTNKGELFLYRENDNLGIPTSIEPIDYVFGVNINCDIYDFVEWITNGIKTIETRNKPTLRSLVGKRIAIVKTQPKHKQKASVIGYVTIKEEITYTNEDSFYSDKRHCITKDMNEYKFNGIKYGYVLSDFKITKGRKEIYTNGIIKRKVEVE